VILPPLVFPDLLLALTTDRGRYSSKGSSIHLTIILKTVALSTQGLLKIPHQLNNKAPLSKY